MSSTLIMSVTFASKVRYDVGIFMHITKEVCFCFDNLQWFSYSQDTHHTNHNLGFRLKGLGHTKYNIRLGLSRTKSIHAHF